MNSAPRCASTRPRSSSPIAMAESSRTFSASSCRSAVSYNLTVTAAEIKARAAELGFDLCGIAPVAEFKELAFLREWLARGYAGEMAYMERSAERRGDVRAVMPSARSVISLATVYNTDRPYSTERANSSTALVARYAWGEDYHEVIQRRMDALVEWMRARAGLDFE